MIPDAAILQWRQLLERVQVLDYRLRRRVGDQDHRILVGIRVRLDVVHEMRQ